MRDVVAACAAGHLDSVPLLDLNYVEDSGGGPDVVVALHANLNKLVVLQMDNKLPLETLETVRCQLGCCAAAYDMK